MGPPGGLQIVAFELLHHTYEVDNRSLNSICMQLLSEKYVQQSTYRN